MRLGRNRVSSQGPSTSLVLGVDRIVVSGIDAASPFVTHPAALRAAVEAAIAQAVTASSSALLAGDASNAGGVGAVARSLVETAVAAAVAPAAVVSRGGGRS